MECQARLCRISGSRKGAYIFCGQIKGTVVLLSLISNVKSPFEIGLYKAQMIGLERMNGVKMIVLQVLVSTL